MTTAKALPAVFEDSAAAWERALFTFLSEKQRRSGSQRTLESYYGMLQHFFRKLGKTPDDVTSQDVFAFAHGTGLSGREPSGITIGARLSCISSFYKFLIRMDIVKANPSDAVDQDSARFAPAFAASDICDSEPSVTSVINAPSLDGLKVKQKTAQRVSVAYDFEDGAVQVRGPDPAAVLSQLEELGGLLVSDGLSVRLDLDDEVGVSEA